LCNVVDQVTNDCPIDPVVTGWHRKKSTVSLLYWLVDSFRSCA